MPIGKHIFKDLVKEKHPTIKYVFITDELFLADGLLTEDDFTTVFITAAQDANYFTKEEFVETMTAVGSIFARDYFYLPVFGSASAGRYITSFFKSNYITFSADVWKIFKGKGKSIDYFKLNPEILLPAVRDYLSTIQGAKTETADFTEDDMQLNKIYEGTGYMSFAGRLYRFKDDNPIMIADFVPIPKEQIYRDDGVSRETYFKIGAYKNGQALPDIIINRKNKSTNSDLFIDVNNKPCYID